MTERKLLSLLLISGRASIIPAQVSKLQGSFPNGIVRTSGWMDGWKDGLLDGWMNKIERWIDREIIFFFILEAYPETTESELLESWTPIPAVSANWNLRATAGHYVQFRLKQILHFKHIGWAVA